VPLPRRLTPRAAAYGLAFALSLTIADSVYRIPIQVSDSLDAIVEARQASSATALLIDASGWSGTTLRPLRYLQARWLLDASDATGLSYHSAFRGLHALLAVAIVLVFAAILPTRRWIDVGAFSIAVTAFIGLHTFAAMFREAFPVNHFAETTFACLAVVALAQAPPRWWRGAAMLGLMVVSLLVIEAGVLVWCVIVAGAALRMPGIRWPLAIAATAILAGYIGVRQYLDIVAPGIGAHGSGYGAIFYSSDELRSRFAAQPLPFVLYNMVGGALSVLLSEPRFGVYQVLTSRAAGEIHPVVVINIVSSLIATVALAVYAWRIRWRHPLDPADRLVAMAAMAIAVSAALCMNYMKDDILTTAGAFYALAIFAPARSALEALSSPRRSAPWMALAMLVLIATTSLWAFRAAGLPYVLRQTAYVVRNDWVWVLPPDARAEWPTDPQELAITERLREEALGRASTSPSFMPRWADRYWVE
jgi:hypothetical protein